MDQTQEFIIFLQSCITPVALVSGVGLLLLSLTNRLGRTIDRTRALVAIMETEKKSPHKIEEIRILYKRSNLLKNSIGSIVISMIFSCAIIPILFFMTFYNFDLKIVGYILFVCSILSIFISIIYFFIDITVSLKALKIAAKEYL